MVEGFDEYFKQMLVYRPDGFIVSDPFIISRINALAPKIPIHISTQQSVANSKSALFFHRNGAQRIILSREVSFAELKPLIKNVKNKLEIETFIHGAVCIGYSGRCVFSNNFCLRDSNIGGCAQCCRWVTSISDDKKTYSNHFSMSAKDMCLIKHIDQLVAAGVKSFKIEGRMKSEYYIACITNAYRNAIDKKYDLATARTHALKAANREVDIA
jgi:putative protease